MSARTEFLSAHWLARYVAVAVVALTLTAIMYGASDAESVSTEALPITTATDAGALKPAVRLSPPSVVPSPSEAEAPTTAADAPAAQIINRSNCRGSVPATGMTIEIADISYACQVFSGGQSTIDSGAVTMITDQTSSLLTTHPGGAGTLWIAAHRTSHGGAFAAVPNLVDGAQITVTDGAATATYQVVGRAYVTVRGGLVIDGSGTASQAATKASIARSDLGGNQAPRLLLQTCDGENNRWMIYADLVSG